MSIDPKALEQKIRQMYPEIDTYKLEMSLNFDQDKNAWIVKLTHKEHELITHVEPADAAKCLEGTECVYLSHQIGQFIRTYCEDGENCALGQK